MNKLVLGKGLGALLPNAAAAPAAVTMPAEQTTPLGSGPTARVVLPPIEQTTAPKGTVMTEKMSATPFRLVPIQSLRPNPQQPRETFDDERLSELAASIRENGLMQPIVVTTAAEGFHIIAGERRFRAAARAGLAEIPVHIIDGITDSRMLELALVENIHREDLNPLELADAYRQLSGRLGLTQQNLADRLGKSRSGIANTMRLLTLPADVQGMIRSGELSEGHARALLSLGTDDERRAMAQKIKSQGLSVRLVEKQAPKRRLLPKRKLPAIAEMESRLKQTLGTNVRIVHGLRRGRIEIEYYGDDDLGRLWDLFARVSAAQQ